MLLGSSPDFVGDVQAAVDSFSALLASPEGAHTSIGEGRDRCQLLLLPGHHHDVPTAAVIPLDADMMGRVEALTRLWRAVEGRPALPDARITPQQRQRLRTMMLAADGRVDGASYRDIAMALYGHKRVVSEPWKTSALRDKVIGLVKGGLTMIGGGYLKLLRHRRRP